MDELARAADKLITAYEQERELLQAWRGNLQQQQEAVTAGAWDDLNALLAAAAPWRQKLDLARQTTRQLEGLLAVAAGGEGLEWENVTSLPPATRRGLAAAARQLITAWEECRSLQEAAMKQMQAAFAAARSELEQVQTARQVARAYRRERRANIPRCLDRQL